LDKASGRPEKNDLDPRGVTGSLTLGRPAWVEVDLGQLRRNFSLIQADKPESLALLSVIKDDAYGHGASEVARVALESGAEYLAVSNLNEALNLRQDRILSPILIFGERPREELAACVENHLTCCINHLETARELNRLGSLMGRPQPVHLKIDTGMSRYGVRWEQALALIRQIKDLDWIQLEGVMSHFSMSDETDKSFANLQFSRFQEVLSGMTQAGINVRYRHTCNSGGFLDLPHAHLDMVRIGILPLGVYPSQVCRRIPGVAPVQSVRCHLASVKRIQKGDKVGYGMRYEAEGPRRIGVLPLGYGDGFPRVRNQGHVLVHGQLAPVVGANAMDATMVDLTDIPDAQPGDTVTLVGRDGDLEISAHDLARWGQTVSYDILCGWRARLPRVYHPQTETP